MKTTIGTTYKIYQTRTNSVAGLAVVINETEDSKLLLFRSGSQAEYSAEELVECGEAGPAVAISAATIERLHSDYSACVDRIDRRYFVQLFDKVYKALSGPTA